MTQMESPKRKMQKKNDYQRHKLFRKIKRRRKAQAEADQQVAMKQLRKKLKLPKFDRGEDDGNYYRVEDDGNYLYKSDIHINKDGSITDVSTGKRYDGVRIPEVVVTARKIPTFKDIEKQIGRKITQDEIDKIVPVDPEIPIELPNVPKEKGAYSPSITNDFINMVVGTAGDAINYLANKAGLPNIAPNEQLVETRDGDALFDLPGYGQAAKLSLYGLGRYGGKFGLKKLQKLAKQKLLEREFALSNADKQLAKGIAYSKPGYDHELIISPSKKQKRLQLSQPTYQVYTGNKHKISEVIDDSGNVNLANLFKIQNEALSNVPGGRLARHRLENPDWHKTDWNTFLHSRDAYQRALQAGYPNEALFPTLMHDAGKLWAGDGHGPYGASIVKQIFPDATDEQIMAIYQHMDKVPESAMGKLVKGVDIAEDNPFRVFKQDSNILKQNSNQNGLSNGKTLSDKIKQGYFNYTKGQEIPLNFDVTNGYGADYYNAYKDLLGKANRTNSYRDWQNVIDFENHIRNSLKYLPAVAPFAIGAKFNDYNSGKDIRIKPSKRGTFTKAAKQHGMSVQGFANRVLRNPSKYSAAMRKKANFAHNASKWNK